MSHLGSFQTFTFCFKFLLKLLFMDWKTMWKLSAESYSTGGLMESFFHGCHADHSAKFKVTAPVLSLNIGDRPESHRKKGAELKLRADTGRGSSKLPLPCLSSISPQAIFLLGPFWHQNPRWEKNACRLELWKGKPWEEGGRHCACHLYTLLCFEHPSPPYCRIGESPSSAAHPSSLWEKGPLGAEGDTLPGAATGREELAWGCTAQRDIQHVWVEPSPCASWGPEL